MKQWLFTLFIPLVSFAQEPRSWIRINQLGYTPAGGKVAVFCSVDSAVNRPVKAVPLPLNWQLVDAKTGRVLMNGKSAKNFGEYGPFASTYRLDFSAFRTPGRYYLKTGKTRSPEFEIGNNVYKGSADFCLRYMRQQRSGFNPFLKDSCHTRDGYTLYGEKAGYIDSTYIDVSGGWHDASDYLQYVTTSANATYHLFMAYRDFPDVFADKKTANGLDGINGLPDVLDEANWGLDWLMKMNPRNDRMFNQLADDRDHMGMRIPKQDSFYGKGIERPVYFLTGEPQQRGKFMNSTTGTSSTAGKFASVFAIAHRIWLEDPLFRKNDRRGGYYGKAFDAFQYGLNKPGFTQTASVRSSYIYAEENWTDDMELASIAIHNMLVAKEGSSDHGYHLAKAVSYAKKEKLTPWLGADTAKHYQWYPFINIGHYELAKALKEKKHGPTRDAGYPEEFVEKFWNNLDTITGFYKEGIERVWQKANTNAFYRGVPFIWCSNNLTTAFAIQCYWYRQLTGDKRYSELEQANIDWLFGCNPWGTSMVYGLPARGDTPVDPHSAFTHLKNYPVDGGLVDGPVYGSIYKNLIGIKLYQPDEYAQFQSGLAVYHDDYGDYSTNEPTMDGTASLIYLLAAKEEEGKEVKGKVKVGVEDKKKGRQNFLYDQGAIIRGDSTKKKIAMVFTGHEYGEGGVFIANALKQANTKASFFFTGEFYRNTQFAGIISRLRNDGHFLGAHSDKHLLYCDWNKRDSLLVTKKEFTDDLFANNKAMAVHQVAAKDIFLPAFEWYNDSIAAWCREMNVTLINFTPGTLSHADYTLDTARNFLDSNIIFQSIMDREQKGNGLNGFILLMHLGAGPGRTDKFFYLLPGLLKELQAKNYQFQTIEELLKPN